MNQIIMLSAVLCGVFSMNAVCYNYTVVNNSDKKVEKVEVRFKEFLGMCNTPKQGGPINAREKGSVEGIGACCLTHVLATLEGGRVVAMPMPMVPLCFDKTINITGSGDAIKVNVP